MGFSGDGKSKTDGDANEYPLNQNTVPLDDTVPVDEVFETEAVHFDDEIQIWDDTDYRIPGGDGFETQVVSFGGETQVLEDEDDICVAIDSDGEGTERTEVLSENDQLLDDGTGDGGESKPLEVNNEESLQASALGAPIISLKKPDREPYSMQTNHQISDLAPAKNSASSAEVEQEVDNFNDTNKHENKMEVMKQEHECNSKVGSSGATEFFPDGPLGKNEGFRTNGDITVEEEEVDQLPDIDDGLAGLSYIDSQEPGDLSQANALLCIETLIDQSKDLFDDDTNMGMINRNTVNCNSTVKGSKELAKKVNDVGIHGKPRAFDWDEKHEDEGGGDIFRRRKEEFFAEGSLVQKSWTEPQKAKGKQFDVCIDNPKSQSKMCIQSNIRLGTNTMDVGEKTMKHTDKSTRKKLISEFDEQPDDKDVTADQLEDVSDENDMLGMMNVGLDTQMAAEAMEYLACGVEMTKCDVDDAHWVLPAHSTHSPSRYRRRKNTPSVEVTTIRSKRSDRIPALPNKPSSSLSKKHLQDFKKDFSSAPTTRKRRSATNDLMPIGQQISNPSVVSHLRRTKTVPTDMGEENNSGIGGSTEQSRVGRISDEPSIFAQGGKIGTLYTTLMVDNFKIPKGRRSQINFINGHKELESTDAQSKLSCQAGHIGKSLSGTKRCRYNSGCCDHMDMKRQTRSSRKLSNEIRDAGCLPLTETETTANLNRSSVQSACSTPVNYMQHLNAVSPVCTGGYYSKLSCKEDLTKEINRSCALKHISTPKDLRKRRDLGAVRVLFSNHLEDDIVKQQQKIVDRLKVSIASSITDATHFIADKFVRTKNMLEAIAYGKPVVTPLWLESVGLAKYYIDEEKYLLRDMKKEKEFGFNMPASLAHARLHPILKGLRVFVTSKAKPSKEIILCLVKAVHGQLIERAGRSAFKDEMITDGLLVLSCEEDREACVPFLEKGTPIYSSELLLNGIITQKLEYDRFRLFQDHIKRTPTIRCRKGSSNLSTVRKGRL